jgi:hypothetical protein
MGKRAPIWPPLPGPVPDKRLAHTPKKPAVTVVETEDGWATVGWVDEIIGGGYSRSGGESVGDIDWTSAAIKISLNTGTSDTANPGANDWNPTTGTTSIGQGWIQNTAPRQRTIEEQYLSDRVKALTEEVRVTLDVSEFRKRRMAHLSQEVADLKSWLLNVQPVEDPEIPGLYLCGICYRRTDRPHRVGCPLIPEEQ